ncbi:MAG: hypothetical protein AB7L13_23935 [Acidimicrobiia bacterium]
MRVDVRVIDATPVDIAAGGYRYASRYELTADHDDWAITATLLVDVRPSGSTVAQATFTPKPHGNVTSDALRKIPLQEIVRNGLRKTPEVANLQARGAVDGPYDLWIHDDVARIELVGVAYELAKIHQDNVIDTVARRLGVSKATAGRWIVEAREQGRIA